MLRRCLSTSWLEGLLEVFNVFDHALDSIVVRVIERCVLAIRKLVLAKVDLCLFSMEIFG